MFTGLIETVGIISHAERVGGGARLEIYAPDFGRDMAIGDSVAVNGACLTVVRFARGSFVVDVSLETLDRTTLQHVRVQSKVNLERAMRLSDRLGGHMVSGHIDGVGTFTQRHPSGNSVIYQFDLPESLADYLIEKGSICIDGVSLTIARLNGNQIACSIIPHTEKTTTLGELKIGDTVNVEADMIAKYVRKFTVGYSGDSPADFDYREDDRRISGKLRDFLDR